LKVVEILFTNSHRVKLVVEMPDPAKCSTRHAPHVPRLLFKLFPHLSRHKCDNDKGYTFRRECQATEIPHLFEHLIIELQGQAHRTSTLKGETEWNWHVDPRGLFHVTVDYNNEMLVLGAIRVAERIMNALDEHQIDALDIHEDVERLRLLAAMGDDCRNGGNGHSAKAAPVAAAEGVLAGRKAGRKPR
jgi:hypothetical protein